MKRREFIIGVLAVRRPPQGGRLRHVRSSRRCR
jgi:hypothetical protein